MLPPATSIDIAIIGVCTLVLLWISRASLRSPGTHGFFRFLAWESMLLLFVAVWRGWFVDPLSPRQLLSWILLIASAYLVLAGVRDLRRYGHQDDQREDDQLLSFEKTTRLVSEGIYAHIRHPLYSSLLFLTWGIFLKQPGWTAALLAAVASVMLWATAKADEGESLRYFGPVYLEYMHTTKKFVPRVL